MVSLWYYVRLIRCTFFQHPQRFKAPAIDDADDARQKTVVVTGGMSLNVAAVLMHLSSVIVRTHVHGHEHGGLSAGNAGIGLETVRHLAAAGLTVIIGCRDTGKGENAARLLEHEEAGKDGLPTYLRDWDIREVQDPQGS